MRCRGQLGRSEEDLVLVDNILLSEDDGLASLDSSETSGLRFSALELEHNLLGVLGLLSEDGLGLTSETCLLHIISSLSLSVFGSLSCLVLRNFVNSVFLQLWAMSSNRLWDMHHWQCISY